MYHMNDAYNGSIRHRAAMTFYLYFLFCHFILCIHTIIERLINYQWYSKLLSELAYTSNIFNTYWKYKWVVTVYQCRAFRWPIWTDRGFCTDLIIQSCIAYPSTLRTGFELLAAYSPEILKQLWDTYHRSLLLPTWVPYSNQCHSSSYYGFVYFSLICLLLHMEIYMM